MARGLLAAVPRRVAHVSAVAACAGSLSGLVKGHRRGVLVSAAWLHDVGYAAEARDTGFHALDGARFLRRRGVDVSVVNLVAHHSCALLEAEERGLEQVLTSEFPLDASLPHDLLCYCDMTTGPEGQRMDVTDRLQEIRERYGPGDVVTRFITRAEPRIVETVRGVEARLDVKAQSR